MRGQGSLRRGLDYFADSFFDGVSFAQLPHEVLQRPRLSKSRLASALPMDQGHGGHLGQSVDIPHVRTFDGLAIGGDADCANRDALLSPLCRPSWYRPIFLISYLSHRFLALAPLYRSPRFLLTVLLTTTKPLEPVTASAHAVNDRTWTLSGAGPERRSWPTRARSGEGRKGTQGDGSADQLMR